MTATLDDPGRIQTVPFQLADRHQQPPSHRAASTAGWGGVLDLVQGMYGTVWI